MVGNMISEALHKVGRRGVVTIENGKCTENSLEIVEGMQFDRGYLSPYFVNNRRKMTVELHNCKLLLVDKKITNPKELINILNNSAKEKYPIVIVAEGIEQEALAPNTVENFQKKILNERIARLSGGIAILQVGAQTQVELKDKQLRIEDALNATKAAIEEGVVVGGGCSLLRLSQKVDGIKKLLDNEEQKIGAEIFRRALSYPARMIAKNAGVNGNVVIDKVLSDDNMNFGYNAARDCYEDLMKAGIMDPAKVVRCCIEHAASVAKAFLTSNAVVIERKELEPIPRIKPMATSITKGLGPIGF
ncbi:Chaperonin 60 subunit beta 4 [Spatholobus suberectus]|nr:Chaperonin 60 subunit beta 4 [Spatholobus suberectus]